jgi:hypothetical protein
LRGNQPDTITAVEYNSDGEYLATGDRVGRITVLKVANEGKSKVCDWSLVVYSQSSKTTASVRSVFAATKFPFCVLSFAAKAGELGALFPVPKPRSRIRLSKKFRNRSEDKPNQVLPFLWKQHDVTVLQR